MELFQLREVPGRRSPAEKTGEISLWISINQSIVSLNHLDALREIPIKSRLRNEHAGVDFDCFMGKIHDVRRGVHHSREPQLTRADSAGEEYHEADEFVFG